MIRSTAPAAGILLIAASLVVTPPGAAFRQPRHVASIPGLPPPSFQPVLEGAATYFIDNTHPNASDADNPNGGPARPRRTIPASLRAGAIVEISGGPYELTREQTWTAEGTPERPVIIRGTRFPVVQGASSQLNIEGSYLAIHGLVFDSVRLRAGPRGLHHFALLDSELRNWTGSATALVAFGSAAGGANEHIVISGNHIHHHGRIGTATEQDTHGVVIGSGVRHVWIVGNRIHHNAGDSIRIGTNPPAPEPQAEFVYIGRNELHDNGENAIDVKQCRNVVIAENVMYGFKVPASGSARGEAIVAHYNPSRVWVINNQIRDSARGIVSTSASGFYVVGNLVTGIHDDAGGSHAVIFRSTRDAHIVNNTVWDVDGGLSITGPGAVVTGNIVGGVRSGGALVAFGDTRAAAASSVLNNLFAAGGMIGFGRRQASLDDGLARVGRQQANRVGEPRFVPGGFTVSSTSPARDAGSGTAKGEMPAVYRMFREQYPAAEGILADISGTARPQGPRWDIGAYEFIATRTR